MYRKLECAGGGESSSGPRAGGGEGLGDQDTGSMYLKLIPTFHFTDEETEAKTGTGTGPRPESKSELQNVRAGHHDQNLQI